MKYTKLLMALILPVSVQINAQEQNQVRDFSHGYVGGSFGVGQTATIDSTYDSFTGDINGSYKFFGGYRANRVIGLELGYLNTNLGDSSIDINESNILVDANLGYTFDTNFRIFTLLGFAIPLNSDFASLLIEDGVPNVDVSPGFHFGIGLEYTADRFSLRLTSEAVGQVYTLSSLNQSEDIVISSGGLTLAATYNF